MPSVSTRQKRFMRIAAHDASFARDAGIPQSVAKEFNQGDKRKAAMKRIVAKRARKLSKGPY